jgi:hypothetical protein
MQCDTRATNDSQAPQKKEKRRKISQGGVSADEGLVMLGRETENSLRVFPNPPPFGPRADAVNITTQLSKKAGERAPFS